MKLAKLHDQPEIFYSIQGEGKSLGKPSVFVRLSLCNLYCVWCDTDYTWNWEKTQFKHNYDSKPGYRKFKKQDYIIDLTAQEIIDIIERFPCNNIIITGGEPMVQHKALLPFLKQLKSTDRAYHIEMETNGTLAPNNELDHLIDQYNVSIKLSNSKVKESDRLVSKAINFFVNSEKSNFKFVIDDRADLEEVLALRKTYNIASSNIYLMPQGTNAKALIEKQQWLVEICKEYDMNYTDRLHVHIYGDQRGV